MRMIKIIDSSFHQSKLCFFFPLISSNGNFQIFLAIHVCPSKSGSSANLGHQKVFISVENLFHSFTFLSFAVGKIYSYHHMFDSLISVQHYVCLLKKQFQEQDVSLWRVSICFQLLLRCIKWHKAVKSKSLQFIISLFHFKE